MKLCFTFDLRNIIFFSALIMIGQPLLGYGVRPSFTCTDNPLEEIYPNQNMCALLSSIPPALRNLPYAMYPNSDVYNTNRFGFNKRFNFFPAAIFIPTNEAEMITVYKALVQNNLPFALRSGGHCFGPGSLSTGYVIDLRNFNAIVPDTNNNTVYIGAGSRLGDVISALGPLNYAIPTGDCPSVGVTGLTLGGGIGFLARQYGLTCDNVVNIRLLTALGTIITVDADNYPDLFWALCGAGAGAFGVVLGFTFTMHYVPEVSYISVHWDWDPAQATQIFNAWQTWTTTLPTTISTECVLGYRIDPIKKTGTSRVTLNALKVGSEPFTEWQSVFSQFNPIIDTNYHGNYIGAAKKFASTPIAPFSKVKSKMLFQPLSQAGLQVLTAFFSQLQENPCDIRVNFFFGSMLNGAISKSNSNSSFFPRSAFGYVFQFAYWFHEKQATQTINLLRQIYRDLEPYFSPYSYANLIDFELGASYLDAYYGGNVNRLIQVKNKYDPTNIFHWEQSIPLTYVPQSPINQAIGQKYCSKFINR